MHEHRPPLLVLGLGSLLLSDDGFGIALLTELRRIHAGDPFIELIDGGTLGTTLLGELEGRRALLILDALAGEVPGEVQRIDDPLARPSQQGIGGHGANASGLLGAASLLGWLPEYTAVVGAVPASLETGIGLSPALKRALPAAVELAQRTLAEFRVAIEEGAACTN